jgi:predicted helicase
MDTTQEYLRKIEKALQRGDATEHTHRPALKELIESISHGVVATNEPRRIECGAPDFIITNRQVPIGYIEAKDVGKSLDEAERSEQLKRYRESLGNIILTDYLEFRWFLGGEHRLTARLGSVGADNRIQRNRQGIEQVGHLLTSFLDARVPTVRTPKELAARMAGSARLMREIINLAFEREERKGSLHIQLNGFRKVLLHDLEPAQFADMYAQTICYGLFAARCGHNGKGPFTRERAAFELPETNPFLREMFDYIAGPRLDKRLLWAVDDLAELLNRTDIGAILEDFGKRTRREDPVVHFYETFLSTYDPRLREMRGVYYTPEPVVSYIVRSVDRILEVDFSLKDGLADRTTIPLYRAEEDSKGRKRREKIGDCHKVLILDPAVGTGTFLYSVIDNVHQRIVKRGMRGGWSDYVSSHLLPRLFGFEVLMAPYAVAHMKLGLQLAQTGYDFKSGERLRIYMTNTLEAPREFTDLDLFGGMIAAEANAAGKVKEDAPVMVVLGNPPYSGISLNMSEEASKLVDAYKIVDGKPLGERKVWLQDDYVKFFRFAQCKIEQTGYGILAFISNNGYLDNPTFRGMRQSLTESFDDIYVLNLHGSSKKKEVSPDGSKDENVFDIQQGVAIGVFVRRKDRKGDKATVHYAELWGSRESKYARLLETEVTATAWKKLSPRSPYYFFTPQRRAHQSEYKAGWSVKDIFPVNVSGIVTARDSLVIDFDDEAIMARMDMFLDKRRSDDDVLLKLGLVENYAWRVGEARMQLRRAGPLREYVQNVLYRPFDLRRILYHPSVVWRVRDNVMRHMLAGENVGLIATRQTKDLWDVFVDCHIIAHKSCARYDINYLFPLYLYPEIDLFNNNQNNLTNGRKPNLSKEFTDDFSSRLGMTFISDGKGNLKKTFGPEDIFGYVYAVFHSPMYRSRYAEFLKIDFPRVPLTSNPDLFRELCGLGERLVALHLMEEQRPMLTSYPVAGDNLVEKVRYSEPGQGAKEGQVWINKTQYFEGVPPDIWEFHIGGYKVCEKWLKDRKGRQLSYDDITYYQQIVSALSETIRLMAEIDNVISSHGGWPIS